MQFKNLIKKRRSVDRFLLGKKKVDWRKILRAIDSARFIPAAGNQYNMKWILVSDKDIIDQLADASQQPFIRRASYVVVVVSDPSVLIRLYGEDGERYTVQQVGAAIENFLLALTEEGLATTWVGHFYHEMVRNLLNISEDRVVEAFFPIGIEGKNSSTKKAPKVELDNIIYFDKWGSKYMEPEIRMIAENC